MKSFDFGEQLNTRFFSNSKIFAGTKTSGIKNEAGDFLVPDGPYNNTSYKIDLLGNQVLISVEAEMPTIRRSSITLATITLMEPIGCTLIFKTFRALNVMDAVMNPAKPS